VGLALVLCPNQPHITCDVGVHVQDVIVCCRAIEGLVAKERRELRDS
jgi:hypothetical protein